MKIEKQPLNVLEILLPFIAGAVVLAFGLFITGCGSESGNGGNGAQVVETKNNAPEAKTDASQSLSVANPKELPECSADNENQLVYVRSVKAFYTCEGSDWETIEIADGKDGVTTVIEKQATNKKNIWVDPVSGYTWLVGVGSYAQAQVNCSGKFAIPSWPESIDAMSRGIMAIAADNSLPLNMWVTGAAQGSPSQWYATLDAGSLPVAGDYTASLSRGIFCVSKGN